jgi:outer membrane biosynthesis protein TonB
VKNASPESLNDLSNGKYDDFFPEDKIRLSELYKDSQIARPSPTVKLVDSAPIHPDVLVMPEYPPLAKLAKVEGLVSFVVEINTQGKVGKLTFESGNPILRGPVTKAVDDWKFPPNVTAYEVTATFEFQLNCSESR